MPQIRLKSPNLLLSGGQTGVDRAALDWAIAMGIPHCGWCPLGRTAQDDPLPERYKLQETKSKGYSQRTRLNVRDADATLIIHHGQLLGGTLLTMRFVARLGKPFQIVDLSQDWSEQAKINREWWEQSGLSSLSIAGPSEERVPGIYSHIMKFLDCLWRVN